ncbi:MAG: Uma2 family endonuclease [Burkholderiales bacterium]
MGTPAEVLEQPLAQARHKLTVTEFQRMGEAGILDEDDRVELIDGAIYDMAPIGSRHAAIVNFLVERLTLSAKGRLLVRGQGPLQIPPYNEPLPDVLLLKPRADRYRDSLPQPADVLLIVEIAHSSLGRDRDVKIPIYAREGIPEAWLVDVQRRVVTVYRGPAPEGYAEAFELSEGSLAPGCLPPAAIALAELFG